MATLTINVPDEMAQTIAALPDANRAAYLARINDFAVSLLASNGTTVPADSTFGSQVNGSGDTTTASEYHILAPSEDGAPFTETDGEALKEAFADFDAMQATGPNLRPNPLRFWRPDLASKTRRYNA